VLVHGYANLLNLLRFAELAELPKVLKMLPYGRIRATRSRVDQRHGLIAKPGTAEQA